MKIVAYGPPSSDKPCIPKVAILEDGSKKHVLGNLKDFDTENLQNPVEMPDEHWFSVLEDGSVETFPVSQASEWASRRASEIISQVQAISGDPLRRLSLLRAAAALVGVPLPDLLAAIAHFESGSESIYEAFLRMKAKKII